MQDCRMISGSCACTRSARRRDFSKCVSSSSTIYQMPDARPRNLTPSSRMARRSSSSVSLSISPAAVTARER